MVMTPAEFALIANTVTFLLLVHPGAVNYNLPVACTTNQQRLERKQKNDNKLQVFKMERMLDKKLLEHVFSCFKKDAYMDLKQDCIG